MSWLKNTISKVRDTGEALKQSQALSSIREKTSNAVAQVRSSAGEALKSSGIKTNNAAELEAYLEQSVRNAKKVTALADLHKSWVQQIDQKGQSYRADDVDRSLGFKEALLRSRALEMTVEVIAADPAIRSSYSELPAADDKTSPVACLHALFSKTLSTPSELWSELIRVSMCSDGLLDEGHIAWPVGAISAMKIDWRGEILDAERKDMALRAEALRQEIKQLETQPGSAESDDAFQRRVAASSELLQTYQAVRKNLEEKVSHRSDMAVLKERELTNIVEQIQGHMVNLQSSAQASTEKQKHLEGDFKQSQESIQLQLQNMADARTVIDKELEELEARKHKLKMELEEVSKQLDETRSKQRRHMENTDKQRNEFEALKKATETSIKTETATVKDAERERGIIERTQQLVRDTDGVVQRALGGQLDDLRKKQAQFNTHFQELLKEHLTHIEIQMQHLRTRAGAAVSSSDAEAMTKVQGVAEAAQQEFEKNMQEYGDLMKEGENAAKIKEINDGYTAVREMIAAALPGKSEKSPTEAPIAAPETAKVETSPCVDSASSEQAPLVTAEERLEPVEAPQAEPTSTESAEPPKPVEEVKPIV